ncbi:unnamed protein product [Adineta steineri]|uniref:Uncharacterized protein n=2 Tax=Adineta steineri TaxID=433720 RepID=A0A819KAA8_9BILA|nr:unnamed protein product [Adineta steineri]
MVIAVPQINLYLTDQENDNDSQHGCLHITTLIKGKTDSQEIMSYFLTESASKWIIQENNLDEKFQFNELYKRNITSEHLYLWSTPIDIIEHYQYYLNHLSDNSELASQIFYNCTLPRFGPLCQYSLDAYRSDKHSSLYEIIYDFYQQEYELIDLTCYTHLKCDLSSKSVCLDWSDICDGVIDCYNATDEEPCWQLNFNDCGEDKYECANRQCISKIFFRDDRNSYECLDRSDEIPKHLLSLYDPDSKVFGEPIFRTEDILCSRRSNEYITDLTRSCRKERNTLLQQLGLSDQPNSLSDICWSAVACELIGKSKWNLKCQNFCSNNICKEIINRNCSNIFNIPAEPVAFGHMFFLYTKQDIINHDAGFPPPPKYICYNEQLCDEFHMNGSLITFNNATCRRPEDFPLKFNNAPIVRSSWYNMYVTPLYYQLSHCNKINKDNPANCNNTNMYRCRNASKCISKHQLCNRIIDCDNKDDEECSPIDGSCLLYGLETLFKCSKKNICISSALINDGDCNCDKDEYNLCDDEDQELHYVRKHISFPTICDGFTELIPVNINGRNETDETECEYWQCNNTYTRCDGFWNCFDGADEVNCNPSPPLNCSSTDHICVSPKTNQFICLPIEKANDNNIDCIGGTDEPKLCRSNNYEHTTKNFYCITNENEVCRDPEYLCIASKCKDQSDIQFCDKTRPNPISVCLEHNQNIRSDIENYFCARKSDTIKLKIVHFSLDKLPQSTNEIIQENRNTMISYSSIKQKTIHQYNQSCHRGLVLRRWFTSTKNFSKIVCLCPPSFYGNICQYQNQRVSVTMKFQVFSDSRQTIFIIVISLIDNSDQRLIHSYQQLTYLYSYHCQRKFNFYLLYSTRPKSSLLNYSIHIDIYEKMSLVHRGSLLIPIHHSFLPVHRVALHLLIPSTNNNNKQSCTDEKCQHGQCIKYSNTLKDISFCQCDRGWSGRYCHIFHNYTCSSDALYVGTSKNNQSICACSLNKWGSRCLLNYTLCYSNTTCYNNGQCLLIDQTIITDKQFICICRKGFSGDRCQIVDNTIVVSFHKDIILPSSILVHFIKTIDNSPPENGSTFKTIPVYQNFVTIFWSHPFHISFIEIFPNQIYLLTVQSRYIPSRTIRQEINPSDRCPHISEVLNSTMIKFHLLRRIKYYHLICQQHLSNGSCFYDNPHFCLCQNYGNYRVANCFDFNFTMQHNCFGESNCENGAQCLQDNIICPQTSICVCRKCYHGRKCQFNSRLFDISLDAIIGYYIRPYTHIKLQPSIIQVSVTMTTITIIISLINSILSLITFKDKELYKTGCGVYLFFSSIFTFFTTIILIFKFWILIITQITYTTNRSFLYFQCISLDFLLRIGLNMNEWLITCVAIERALTVIKGTRFDQKQNRRIAKYVIIILFIFITSTSIHDPINRNLLSDGDDNNDDKRIWCIVSYSDRLQIYNTFIYMFHFFVPFIFNILSAVIIIIMTTRQRTVVHSKEPYKKLLREQIKQHIHLLISPFVLISLAIPRLIIFLVGRCVDSIGNPWLLLTGYFISFFPLIITFIIFVVPSKTYTKIFKQSLTQYRQMIRSQLHFCQ